MLWKTQCVICSVLTQLLALEKTANTSPWDMMHSAKSVLTTKGLLAVYTSDETITEI